MDIVYPKRKATVKATPLPGGQLVLFDEATDWAHTLNPMGAMAWELSDGTLSISQISSEMRQLVAELPLDENQLINELNELFSELKAAGLVDMHLAPISR